MQSFTYSGKCSQLALENKLISQHLSKDYSAALVLFTSSRTDWLSRELPSWSYYMLHGWQIFIIYLFCSLMEYFMSVIMISSVNWSIILWTFHCWPISELVGGAKSMKSFSMHGDNPQTMDHTSSLLDLERYYHTWITLVISIYWFQQTHHKRQSDLKDLLCLKICL